MIFIRRNLLKVRQFNCPEIGLIYPVPPYPLLVQALGPNATPESYLQGGYTVWAGIGKALPLIHKRYGDFKRVLDFGCESGRLLMWFQDLQSGCEFHGADTNREAINWCKENLPFAKYYTSDPLPPLPFPNEYFDLIYAVSVLTHMDEECQKNWLKELRRIAKLGGVVILTVHGDRKAYMDLSPQDHAQFQKKGLFCKRVVVRGGVDGLPDYYQVAYHSRGYVERVWSGFFKVSAYVRHGPLFLQDLVLTEKAEEPLQGPDDNPDSSYMYLDLPICCLDAPGVDVLVKQDQLSVSGWAFDPDGRTVDLDLWVDGARCGRCSPDMPRPDVGGVFTKCRNAKSSGFSTTLSTKDLGRGAHELSLSAGTSLMPCMITRFFKP